MKANTTLRAEYRAWCPDCVHGCGVSHPHRSCKDEKLGREFSIEYAFMTAEDADEDVCPVLVGYDHNSNGIWALAVDRKGDTASSTKWVTGKIDEAGCSGTAVTIRSDLEESVVAFRRRLQFTRRRQR